MSQPPQNRHERVVDAGLQPERTALAWERTAVSSMVAGLLLARYAAQSASWTVATAGLAQTLTGATVLAWTGHRYADLHGPIQDGIDVVHPAATRFLGLVTLAFAGFAFALAAVQIGTR